MTALFDSMFFRLFILICFVFTITACGGGGGGSDTAQSDDPAVNISNNDSNDSSQIPQNRIPVTNAGADLLIGERRTVLLTGDASDPDGDQLAFMWTQIAGAPVSITDAGTQNASFIAPATDVTIILQFRLTVSDNISGSSSDDILVQITNDVPPTANAGSDQTVNEQSSVILDGTTSADPGGNIISFLWSQVSGAVARLDDSASPQPKFIAPAIAVTSELIFELTVVDEIGNTAIDTVKITVNPLPAGAVPADANRFLTFLNQSSPLFQETQESADAYYAAVDPLALKVNLNAWKSANGFDLGADARAVYRNAADLGFGRVMSMRTNNDGSAAAYVENYATLNEAVVAVESGIRNGLLATVAMEHSTHPDDPNGAMYTKFYTFDGNDERVTKIDLDGRGEKFQPGLCVVCHGGQPNPLVNGIYPDNGDTGAQFLPWDLDTFEYSENPLFTRAAQEGEFKKLNQAALATYPNVLTANDGKWLGNSSRELIEGWYGDNGADLPAATFNGEFVPIGWRTPANGGPVENPADVEELYLKVIGPNCRACHIQRGRAFAGSVQGEFVDFTTYDKFNNYRSKIIELVFDQGKMPDANVTFNNFWSEKGGVVAAELLGVHFGVNALERRPGRPIANPGQSRQAAIGNIRLSGEASLFAQTFAWSFAQNGKPLNSDATIIGDTTATPTLVTDIPGAYVIQLVVSDGITVSEPVATTIVSLNGVSAKSFSTDVTPIIVNDCQSCHSIGLNTSVAEIPVLFDDPSTLYTNILSYINFESIIASPLLTKAAGQQHGAGVVPREGFDLSAGAANQDNYNIVLTWIAEGAQDN